MEHWTEYSRFFIALLVILDPFMAIPIYLQLTAGFGRQERRRVVNVASLTVLGLLSLVALSGETLLRWMGTSLGSFRVGGGIVLLLMALAMLKSEPDPVRSSPDLSPTAGHRASLGAVPLAVPLLAGPGAMSTVIIGMQRSSAPWHPLLILACILLVTALLWLVLRLAGPIGRALGETGLSIVNRLFGLILAAIAVEVMANGLKQLFPVLGG